MPFLHNLNPEWIEDHYKQWLKEPSSVEQEWQLFFEGFELGRTPPPEELHTDLPEAMLQSSVQSLIYRYRDIGHLLACTDPLSPCPISHPLLDLAAFDLSADDLDRHFHISSYLKKTATLREILADLQATYCRSIGIEFMHIMEPAERQWLIDRMEPVSNQRTFNQTEQLRLLSRLQQGTLFEDFLQRRFPGQKRFSLEGGESLLTALDSVINNAEAVGINELIIGMSHRGRLNVLANIIGKPLSTIFAEFTENGEGSISGDGDVKYHKGYSADIAGVHLSLAFNPSHLEAVDPVVIGKSRARQEQRGTTGKHQLLPILVHGDAAFAGQGMVAETLNLSQLEGYSTGGTLHIVLNNQIGFTTLPKDSRSTRYATDVARMLMIPVFHVHGEDPEAVAFTAELALAYRQQFGRDVVIEIICYRRHGHNEGDEPSFTQPQMYEQIKARKPLHIVYGEALSTAGIPEDAVQQMADAYKRVLEQAIATNRQVTDQSFSGDWKVISRNCVNLTVDTAFPAEQLKVLMMGMAELPEGFAPHTKIVQLYSKRVESVVSGNGIDWGTAESLAFASLISSGMNVRLSGQDSRRGTFNHRHAVLHDTGNGSTYVPLTAVAAGGGNFNVYDSMLSENAVLGFEYGYSIASPHGLTIWEAQFGDFANGAQVIIDQFIAAGESKWGRASGIVMFLPHGYEGNGAEHSSARIERFLSLCAENNLQVVNSSTPAQIFHLLRRQILQPFRKPLIVFTPKSLFRNPLCVSTLEELSAGRFMEIIPDPGSAVETRRVILCSGKIYYDLLAERLKKGSRDIAIIRIEQLYPFNDVLLKEVLQPFGIIGKETNSRLYWAQEEPMNMGAWPFLRSRLAELVDHEPFYIGRREAAAPATGSHRHHAEEQMQIIAAAFTG